VKEIKGARNEADGRGLRDVCPPFERTETLVIYINIRREFGADMQLVVLQTPA
jgi:hypothetical protein